MFTIIFVICGSIVLVTYFYFGCLYLYWKRKNVEFIKPTFPFGNIGKILFGINGLSDSIQEWYQQCSGQYAGLFFITSPGLIIKDPELIKYILVRDFNYFTDRGLYNDEKKEPTSGHLFKLTGERWKSIRNKLTPAFTAGKLKIMFSTLTDVAHQLKTYLELQEESSNTDIEDITTRFNADIIASTIFGIEINSFKNKFNKFIVLAKDLFVPTGYIEVAKIVLLIFFPTALKYLNIRSVKEAQDKFIFHMVQDVINFREENKVTRSDLMQLLIQLKNKGKIYADSKVDDLEVFDGKESSTECGLTLHEVAAQAYSFFFAGYETASSTMNYLLYECSLNHKLQEALQKDIDYVIDKYDGAITYESILEMEFLDKAISETLRKYPILPYLNRVATKDYIIPGTEVCIEKGTRVAISVIGIQHDPKYYPDPQKFDPNRFQNDVASKRHPFTYIPFGEGPRNCIGKRLGRMMVAVGMAMLLRNFTVDVSEKTQIPLQFNHLSFFLQTSRPLELKISKRF